MGFQRWLSAQYGLFCLEFQSPMGMHGFSKRDIISLSDFYLEVSIPDGDAWVFKGPRCQHRSGSISAFQSPMGMHGFSKLVRRLDEGEH
jgi:hypothetical protein